MRDVTRLRRSAFHDRCPMTRIEDGNEEPCDKTAIAGYIGTFEGEEYVAGVCAYHAHMLGKWGRFIPLTELLAPADKDNDR